MDPGFNYDGMRLRAEFSGQQLDESLSAKDPAPFMAEAGHFSRNIQNGEESRAPGEEGLRDMKLIAEIYRSAGLAL